MGNEEVNADKRLGTIDVTEPNIVTENTAVVESMRNEMPRVIAIPPAVCGRQSEILARVKTGPKKWSNIDLVVEERHWFLIE